MPLMSREVFLDTNVLIYAFASSDVREARAKAVVANGGRISVQVVNEFIDVSRRKRGWSWDRVEQTLEVVHGLVGRPLSLTDETYRLAIRIARDHGFRIYDSLIISAAKLAGCTVVMSEDMQARQVVEGVEIRNPFMSPDAA
jgi:predicted nucleic acid-binding protein